MVHPFSDSQSDLESETNFNALQQRHGSRPLHNENQLASAPVAGRGSINRTNDDNCNKLKNNDRGGGGGGTISDTKNDCNNSTGDSKQSDIINSGNSNINSNNNSNRNNNNSQHNNTSKCNESYASSKTKSTKTSQSSSACSDSTCSDGETTSSGEPNLPYPGFPEVSLKYLTQDTRPRNWCLWLITNPLLFVNTWFERTSILVILLNCITLGMYQPCVDDECVTNRCKILQSFDDIIFLFFALEMTIKMVAMGIYGKNTYLADSWNRLDFFIVLAGALEYSLHVENLNLTAIRTIRVLRPLRAINRIPSMRILVMLLLDTLPMLGNVLLLCFFVFFIFGIIGVQLWEGILRQRCALELPPSVHNPGISFYYEFSKEQDYICTKPEDSGMHACANLPPYRNGEMLCNETALPGYSSNRPTSSSCVNWNQYYTNCTQLGGNPFQGTISFDNIGLAWVAIFLVISLEGWTDIMYYVQDAHSFWDWIYFVLLIVIGSFFMINLCLVVIATQFSETKKREMERMRQERARFTSTSTLASSTNNSEPTTCYAEIVKYIGHLWRRFKRRLVKKLRLYKYQRQQRKEGLLPNTTETLTLSPNRIRAHHIKCINYNRKTTNLAEPTNIMKCPIRNSTSSLNSNASITNISLQMNNSNNNNNNNNNKQANYHKNNQNNINNNDSQISSPENSDVSSFDNTVKTSSIIRNSCMHLNNTSDCEKEEKHRGLLKAPSVQHQTDSDLRPSGSGFLSPPNSTCGRRRSSVMFSDYITQHSPPDDTQQGGGTTTTTSALNNKNLSEKMTQTTEGVWQVNLPEINDPNSILFNDYSELNTMTCQELLAFSGLPAVFSALPAGHQTLDSFYFSLKKQSTDTNNLNTVNELTNQSNACAVVIPPPVPTPNTQHDNKQQVTNYLEDFSCCYELYQAQIASQLAAEKEKDTSKLYTIVVTIYKIISKIFRFMRKYVRMIVEHKYFQQGILLAILINTLSMGIEFHNQPETLTITVETSNIVFSAIFAVEMLLKVVAEGPFKYVANGFNVFDGIIVILSVVELCQQFMGGGQGSSGLSVLRTFRLLRILKLVRFMPNLRRQLFVMLRTMDNVAVFFSLLILFIFIFSILGMYLFGGKFCKFMDDSGQERECTCPEIVSKHPQCECDRKHFNNILWATVTVFQILTQEDWNVVLFNGMEKTSHWAALYFVALMTFGNYVLFNLLVAILVEGFSSERNERREREQRELVKAKLREEHFSDNLNDLMYDEAVLGLSDSTSTSDSYHEIRNRWHSADELRKGKKHNKSERPEKSNIQKQRLLQPSHDSCETKDDCHYKRDFTNENNLPKKSNSVKERRGHSEKSKNFKPPIITTTAATPQDSPNRTLEQGPPYKNWDNINIEVIDKSSCQSIPSLLKPPSVLSSFKALDDRIYFDRIPSPVLQVENGSLVQSSNRFSVSSNNIINGESKLDPAISNNSISNILPNSINTGNTNKTDELSKPDEISDSKPNNLNNTNGSKSNCQRSSSFKKFRRSSSKRNRKVKPKSESDANEEVVLNNGRDHSITKGGNNAPQFRSKDSILSTTNRIQNDTKETNCKVRSQNSIKGASGRRGSYVFNNSQLYQNLNRSNSIKNYARRMSSIELVYEKASNLNSFNYEIQKLQALSKIDVNKLEKSCSNTNVSEDQRKSSTQSSYPISKIKILIQRLKPKKFTEEREDFALYLFPPNNRFRQSCSWFVNQKWFDNVILLFIALNCITLAMERPNIPPYSTERFFLATANYVFTVVFAIEMFIKVVAAGMFYGADAYFTSGWNIMDGSLVIISIIDLLMSLISESSPKIFGILRVFRLLRSLRPLRVINRAPGLKLVVQTLLSSLRPIGNIVLICCTFFIIFGILGVQLFKGTFYFCQGESIKGVKNKTECLSIVGNEWVNRKYNFDDLGKALMSLFVLSSRDGWVNIMYTGLDAVGVDQQPIVNFNEWRLLYFIAFILLVGFFVLNMFVGVVVENFHRCREEQEKEEKMRRAAKKALQMDKRRRRLHEPPYYCNYSPIRLFVHNVVTSKYFDLAIAAVIGLNVVTMAMEYYMMPLALAYALKIFNYFFTAVFILEAIMKLVALGVKIYMKDKWNQLDVAIVILSIVGIILEELETNIIPINPTIIRVMRVLRIARVLKLLKMAKGIRALLDTVMQALPQVGNLGLLFFLLFFIFAALGVELFGRLECSELQPCQGLGEHAHFENFGMAFLTLFRVATGDNWNGIMKDTLRDNCDDTADCVRNCCVSTIIAPIFFVIFVLMAQFVLVNVVVAVLMKHLEESHKQMEEDLDIDTQLERELEREQEFEEDQALCNKLNDCNSKTAIQKRPLTKAPSLPKNFQYSSTMIEKKYNSQRRQTVQYFNQNLGLSEFKTYTQNANIFNEQNSFSEAAEMSFNNDSEVDLGVGTEVLKQKRVGNINSSIRCARLGKQTSFDETKRNEYRKPNYESFLRKSDKIMVLPKTMPRTEAGGSNELRKEISEATKRSANELINDKDTEPTQRSTQSQINAAKHSHLFGKSYSVDVPSIGETYLSVPQIQPRFRSGSLKQLLKQAALEEDPDVDESSFLIPSMIKQNSTDSETQDTTTDTVIDTTNTLYSGKIEKPENIKKSDSSEILRIISERRRVEKRESDENTESTPI